MGLLACCVGAGVLQANTAFRPGEVWNDTDGKPIRAHSAGLLLGLKGDFYWYGADNYTSGDGTNVWINSYWSTDLLNWQNLGHVYTHPGPFPCPALPGAACGEADRPKVVRHPSGRVVMVVKSHPAVSFASAASEAGPFVFSKTVAPNGGNWAGDLTVFVDPQSPADAYLIYSGGTRQGGKQGPRGIVVAKLTDDWLDVVPDQVTWIPDNREGPAAFYAPGIGYFIWTSHTTGWNPNPAAVYHADSIASPNWTPLGNPTGSKTSFGSQSTYILPVNGSFIYVADRFEPFVGEKVAPRYVWLPITNLSKTGLTVDWHDEWIL